MTGTAPRGSVRPARRRLRTALMALLGLAVLGAGAAAYVVEQVGVMPRALAPYVERRASGHNPLIVKTGHIASRTLLALDRGASSPLPADDAALILGAQPHPAGQDRPGLVVDGAAALRAALARAEPGVTITILPGTYRVAGRALEANRPGRADAPIVVRAAQPGSVVLALDLEEGFRVSAPHWRFENLDIRGACRDDGRCEHAFHVIGEASHFASVNNRIGDFNAHIKINGWKGKFPDHGLIEANTLYATRARRTANPVVPIDLVGASHWTMRANIIKDFVKDGGNRISYGAFAKGAGGANLFERNLVWCEQRLRGHPGQRVGLSLGGGATGARFCRDGKCIVEQDGGVLRANLIVGCSDVGIYLNSAATSQVLDNTLLDTAGIDVRFPTSSARVDGNLVDGPIRSREGGLLRLGENRSTPLWRSYTGLHPVRGLFVAPDAGDWRWDGAAPRRGRQAAPGADLCGVVRAADAAYGAFDDFSACLAPAARRPSPP